MASVKEVVLNQLGSGQFLFDAFIADLSDEEFFKPPVPGANHAGWVLGHIAVSEDSICAAIEGSSKKLPARMEELFGGASECHAEPARYPSRKEIEDTFRSTRARTVEALKAFDESRWNEPAPEGYPTELFPTMGSMWGLQGTHQFWHIGQLTVCRQALRKKRVLMGD